MVLHTWQGTENYGYTCDQVLQFSLGHSVHPTGRNFTCWFTRTGEEEYWNNSVLNLKSGKKGSEKIYDGNLTRPVENTTKNLTILRRPRDWYRTSRDALHDYAKYQPLIIWDRRSLKCSRIPILEESNRTSSSVSLPRAQEYGRTYNLHMSTLGRKPARK